MKKLFFALAFMLIGTASTFATTSNVITEELTYEYTTIVDFKVIPTCYVRVCWNASETSRRCTDWQQVPCEVVLELEGSAIE